MANETKVKVRLDTRQAKSQLSSLVRESTKTAGKVSSGIRSAVGRGLGAVGFGAAVGTGIAAVRSATTSGAGDIVSEAFGPLGAQLNEFFFGDIDDKARATRSAREETIQAFGAVTGARGEIPGGAGKFFDSVKRIHLQAEMGRSKIESDERFSTDTGAFVSRIASALGEELTKAVDYMISLIPFVGGK